MNQVSWWQRFTWRHPEWWALGLSLAAWLLFLAPYATGVRLSHHRDHANGVSSPWTGEIFWWTAMVIAMMLPLIVDRIRIAAARSIWARRDRAVLLFTLGYLATWILAGLIVQAGILGLHLQPWFRPAVAGAGAFGLAALWQLTAAKQRVLRSCHRTIPLAPHGWRANLDCLRYGWMIGATCVLSCGALMVACTLSGHSVAVMAGAGSIGAAERYMIRPNPRILSAAIAALGLVCGLALSR